VRIAGLDLSKTSTGWACWAPGDTVLASGTWELGSSFTSRGRVFAKLHENMMALESLGHVDAWFYEEPIHPAQLQGQTNADTIKLAAGLAAHVESAAEAFGARIIRAVNMSTWRREFLGKLPRSMRTADLKDMAMSRCRQLGFKPLKHDQAEAIGIVDYGCASLDVVPFWRAQEVLMPMMGARV
jgi:hypothetical protein